MGINDYLKAIHRRWPVVVVAGLLGLLIGYLVAPSAANQAGARGSYSAAATVLQAPDVKDPVASTTLLATSDAVAERVSKGLSTHPAPQELLLQVAAVGDKTSNAITITASDTEPQTAMALANAFAQGTVDEFLARHRDAAAARFTGLEGQLTDVDDQLKQVTGSIGAVSGPVNPVLQARGGALSARYAQIYASLQEAANQANNPTGLEILSPAVGAKSNAGPFSLSTTTARTVVGLALGLLLGGALALVLEHFDTRPRDRSAAQHAYRLPVLAEIPKIRHSERRDFALITTSQPESSAAEAYRSLRSTIMFTDSRIRRLGSKDIDLNGSAHTTQRPQVILVTSACAAEGKTATVVNLAACFADVGKRVLVLDCDFRGPDAHQYLGVSPSTGLSNLLTSMTTVDLSQHVRQSDIPHVDVITAGTQLERPSTLVARIGDLMAQARELADIVLIDSAPMLLANDAMDLIPYVDAVLVVSYTGRATSEQAQRISELLTRTRAPVIGVALVGANGRPSRDLMSYPHGTREDLIAMDLPRQPSQRMTVPTPADGGAEQKRTS
jgi:capsular exopolysaccharide synthesis family protein